MAHISRLRKRFDPAKLKDARIKVLKEHADFMQRKIDASRRGSAAEAKKMLEKSKGEKSEYKPIGVFDYDELIYCKIRYGAEIVKDADFWKFWQKANDQSFMLRA